MDRGKLCTKKEFASFSQWYNQHGESYKKLLNGNKTQTRSVTFEELKRKLEEIQKNKQQGGDQ